VLPQPVSFDDLYHQYAKSWRVPSKQSLLCKGKIDENIPTAPYFAGNLDPGERDRLKEICTGAGVTSQSLLDACILDTAVLGTASAAKAFVDAPVPTVEMRPAP
jgi:hypothetical protein